MSPSSTICPYTYRLPSIDQSIPIIMAVAVEGGSPNKKRKMGGTTALSESSLFTPSKVSTTLDSCSQTPKKNAIVTPPPPSYKKQYYPDHPPTPRQRPCLETLACSDRTMPSVVSPHQPQHHHHRRHQAMSTVDFEQLEQKLLVWSLSTTPLMMPVVVSQDDEESLR